MAPSPSLCAGAAALARLQRHFSTMPHAPPCSRRGRRFGPARSSAHPTPRYFFLSAVCLRLRRTRPRAPAKERGRPVIAPPLGPAVPMGCGPDSGAAAQNLRPSWARGNNSARPCLPAAAPAPYPARHSRGRARAGSG